VHHISSSLRPFDRLPPSPTTPAHSCCRSARHNSRSDPSEAKQQHTPRTEFFPLLAAAARRPAAWLESHCWLELYAQLSRQRHVGQGPGTRRLTDRAGVVSRSTLVSSSSSSIISSHVHLRCACTRTRVAGSLDGPGRVVSVIRT
jgi:hypothetical protein